MDQPPAKRSPLKKAPLRNPGESLSEEIDRQINERAMYYAVMILVILALVFFEWYRWVFKLPISPMLYTFIAIPFVAFCCYKFISIIRETRNLRLGLSGEKAVGQYLEKLRAFGCRIYHDIPPEGKGMSNIDHLIVCPQGIFVVETKARSKPGAGESIVSITPDNKLLFNGQEPDRDAVAQIQALRDWLRRMLKETTSRDFPVRGIITIPGWFVRGKPDVPGLWILNPKGISSFIGNTEEVLAPEDIALVCSRIADYVRIQQGKSP